MSASRFWGSRRARREESEQTAAGALAAGSLTATDRCDRCGARAYVRVLLPSCLELLFCAHHGRQHASALTKIAVHIQDETARLARPATATWAY
jgi:hypothetical protein